MATASQPSPLESFTETAQKAARLGARALRVARSYERPSAATLDDAIKASKAPRRRRLIAVLAERRSYTVSNLADELAAMEYGNPSTQERKRVYVSIYQTHVPKLDDLNLVHYDQDGGTVTATPRLNDVAAWLDDGSLRFGGGGA